VYLFALSNISFVKLLFVVYINLFKVPYMKYNNTIAIKMRVVEAFQSDKQKSYTPSYLVSEISMCEILGNLLISTCSYA